MAIIISRRNHGKPIREEELPRFSLTENPEIDKTLNQVLMRLNRKAGEFDVRQVNRPESTRIINSKET